ncbi:MAG: ATP-binding protein [Oligoflexia bacterium]|nr:ATP-binding protein [Oligoflexia bacterium]
MEVLAQSSLLVSITSFAIGFSVIARNVRNKLFLMFSILMTVISAWALFFFLAKFWNSPGFYKAHLLAHIWLAPTSLAFIRTLVKLEDAISRTLLSAALVIACILSGLLALGYESRPVILEIIHFAPGAVVLQLLQLIWLDRKGKVSSSAPSQGGGRIDRRLLIYLGGLLVLAISSLDHVPWLGLVVPSIGNVALTAYLFFLSQAVLQQRFLNFGSIFSRFLVLLAMALMLTVIYSVIFTFIEGKPALFFLNSFIVSFLLLMMLEPVRSMVGYLTQRLLTQKYQELLAVLRHSQRTLSGITESSSLFQAILSTSDRLLRPEGSALFLLQSDGTLFRRAAGDLSSGLTEILATHPLVEHCIFLRSRNLLPVLLDQVLQNEIDRSASRKQREYYASLIDGLRALNANLLIPLFDDVEAPGRVSEAQCLGFVVLRVSNPPEPWGNNWGLLSVIYPYFEQAARAMRSLEVFARQREKERLAALGEMAAGLAHEIRNPLGAIKGAAQYLETEWRGQPESRPDSRFLEIIVEETDRLNRVVTQFLEYSKPWSVEPQRVELGSLVARTLDVVRATLPEAVRLEFRLPPSPVSVTGSPEQLRQVLINLIQNSLRAVQGRSQPLIRVGLGVDPRRPSEVVIAVEDNGHGIRRENLSKLFIPFFTTSPQGTGLGLSICQRIIEAHRGRIEVVSEDARFTRFSVILPTGDEVTEEAHGSGKSSRR